jgi:hypothetical protein
MGRQSSAEHGTIKIEDIESGLLRQRRNLLIISIGIIIFEFGGGALSSVPLGYGNVILTKPEVALYFVWASLPYALWRYWLYREPAVAAFDTELINRINSLKSFKSLVKEVRESLDSPELNLDNDLPVIVRGVFKRHLNFSVAIHASEKAGPNIRKFVKKTFQPAPIISVSFLRIEAIELWARILTIINNRGFSDYYLPYLLGYFAVGLLLAKHAL